MIAIVGDSHAPKIFLEAARQKGFVFCSPEIARLVIVAEDTPINEEGRDEETIRKLLQRTLDTCHGTILLTSQVTPGFTRSFNTERLYHQSETLRIKDALERALHPEQMIIGCMHPERPMPEALLLYLIAFNCPVWPMTYEEAEFSKIAINMTLASQVENTNRLYNVAQRIGVKWESIATVLKHDKRIGPHSYLEPGDWKQSKHLLRDYLWIRSA